MNGENGIMRRKNSAFTARQLKRLDMLASSRFNIPSIILMENAGRVTAETIRSKFKHAKNIVCIIGKGNNGGDGLVAARYLYYCGLRVHVYFISKSKPREGTLSYTNYKILESLKNIKISFGLERLVKLPSKSVLIDAIFGIGLSRPLDLDACMLIDRVNNLVRKSRSVVVAVDIPSGLHPDNGLPNPVAIKARYTVTFGFMKKGFSSREACHFLGKVVLANIGYPPELN